MATHTIGEYFDEYKDSISADIAGGKILRLVFTEDMNDLECVASFENTITFDSVSQFEQRMRNALNCGFSLHPRFTPDKLTAEYFGELCKFMKSRFPFVNGFLDDAESTFDGKTFTVTLKHGGFELMKKAGIYTVFSRLVTELFSTTAEISFEGVLTNDMEQYEQAQREFFESMPMPDIKAYEEKAAAAKANPGSGESAATEFRTVDLQYGKSAQRFCFT